MRRRIIPWLAWGFVLAWAASWLLPDGPLRRYLAAKEEVAALADALQTLRKEEAALLREIHALRHDRIAMEAAIHRELGYVHPDEVIILRK